MSTGLRRPFHESQTRNLLSAAELFVRAAAPSDDDYIGQFFSEPRKPDERSLHLIGIVGNRRVGLLSLRDEEDGSLAITVHVSPHEPDAGIGNRILLKASEKMRHTRLSVAAWRESFYKMTQAPTIKPPGYTR